MATLRGYWALVAALGAAQAGESLIAPGGIAALAFHGAQAHASVLPTDGPDGAGNAIRVVVRDTTTAGALQLRTLNTLPAMADQPCLISFQARMVVPAVAESDTGDVRVVVEHHQAPFVKSLAARVILRREWQEFHLPFRIRTRANTPFAEAYAPGTLRVGFHLGGRPQGIELADFRAILHGQEVPLESLPRTLLTYEGREADAPWRQAAAERIRQHRMADLTVRVVDEIGRASCRERV